MPLIEASVSTRVVSWNDAAEMKLSVVRAARVMPKRTGLATAGLIASDKNVARELTEGPPGKGVKVSNSVSYAGTSYALFGFAGGLYAVGRLSHNDGSRQTGLLALEALVDTTIVVESLKAMTQRERPTQGSEQERLDDASGSFGAGGASFPSGHAINSFAFASVMAARYPDRPLIKYGAYGFATAVSISRVTSRRHFPSDVLIGSSLARPPRLRSRITNAVIGARSPKHAISPRARRV